MAVVEPTLEVESQLWAAGYETVIGCDEVGRGAIAGPVAVGVAAVSSARGAFPAGLRDSKLISATKRTRIHPDVVAWVAGSAVGSSTADEIDDDGIMASLGRAADRAITALLASGTDPASSVVLLDGHHDWLSRALTTRIRVVTRVKADRDCAAVSAASVVAKVDRDALMTRHDEVFPDYGWARNKGYGSSEHYAAIDRVGASPLHRRSWLRTPAGELAGLDIGLGNHG